MRFLTRFVPQRHGIGITQVSGEDDVMVLVQAKWWPPFAAVEFFAPRYRVVIWNVQAPSEWPPPRSWTPVPLKGMVRVTVAAKRYEGVLPVGEGDRLEGWRGVGSFDARGSLEETGTQCAADLTLRTGALDAGTYTLRLDVNRVEFKAADDFGLKLEGKPVATAYLNEYLRVEPVSTVITLAVATGTFLTVLATMAVVLFG